MTTERLLRLSKREREANRERLARKKRYTPDVYDALLAPLLDDGHARTLAEFVANPREAVDRIVLIRHDIDHDYETALAMAEWEHERGIRATYCVLHTAWYYGELRDDGYRHTDELCRLCRQLHAWGHEVNLHNNAAVVGLQAGIDPAQLLQDELAFLRRLGVPIVGTAMHGDALCRQLGFRNCEVFREAVRADLGGERTVGHGDAAVNLGTLTYSDLDLTYEAYDMAWDRYITDSGGPLRSPLERPGRARVAAGPGVEVVGVLTHPVWWSFGRAGCR